MNIKKYIVFIIIAIFAITFVNIDEVRAVDSQITCTYDGEDEIAKGKYHIVLQASKAGDYLETSTVSGYFNEGEGLIKQSHNKMNFHGLLKLKENRCPTIYGYFSPTKMGTILELYDTLQNCQTDGGLGTGWAILGGNTDRFCKPLSLGVYKINGEKQCTDSQIKDYNKETLEHFKRIDSVKEYETKMNKIDLKNQNADAIEQEFNAIFEEYTNIFNESIDTFKNIEEKYDCDLSEKILSDLEDQKKLYNEVYYPRLKKYKDKLINETIDEINDTGGDSSYLEKVKEEVNKHIDNLKTDLNENIQKTKDLHTVGIEQNVGKNCENILGNNLIADIQQVFDWIKIIAPILLILFGSIDYGKAVISNDNDSIKKATNNFIKRAIAAIAIFFLPYFINLLLNLPGIKEHIEVDDPLCTVEKVVIK